MKNKILLVHSGNQTFVRLDISFLKQHYHVDELYVDKPFPKYFYQYIKNIKQTDVLFCWFASWNSFWAILISKLLRKPSVLVVGGYDLANLPNSDYGHQRSWFNQLFSRSAMKLSSGLITNSYYSQEEAERNAKIPSTRLNVVYHGLPDQFMEISTIPKEKIALAVGDITKANLKRKGWEAFVRSASYLPDIQFIMAGRWVDDSIQHLKSIASDNVQFLGRVSDEELLCLYQRASYYIQPSLHEGFGMTVAESMLACCIPVVSCFGALPEVVGDCGIYLKDCDPKTIAEAIKSIPSDNDIGVRARQRILDLFPPQKRLDGLSALINDLLHESC